MRVIERFGGCSHGLTAAAKSDGLKSGGNAVTEALAAAGFYTFTFCFAQSVCRAVWVVFYF